MTDLFADVEFANTMETNLGRSDASRVSPEVLIDFLNTARERPIDGGKRRCDIDPYWQGVHSYGRDRGL